MTHGVEGEHMNVCHNGRELFEKLQPIPTPSEGQKIGKTLAGVLSSGCSVPGWKPSPGEPVGGVGGGGWVAIRGQRRFGCPINTCI